MVRWDVQDRSGEKTKSKLNQNHAEEKVAIVFGTPGLSNGRNGVFHSFRLHGLNRISGCMFVWGTLTMLLAACKTAASLYATRFFLGIFEAVSDKNNWKANGHGKKDIFLKALYTEANCRLTISLDLIRFVLGFVPRSGVRDLAILLQRRAGTSQRIVLQYSNHGWSLWRHSSVRNCTNGRCPWSSWCVSMCVCVSVNKTYNS